MYSEVNSLFQWKIDRDVQDLCGMETMLKLDLSKLSDRNKSTVTRFLRQGYATALSGTSFKVYLMLSAAFKFPAYSLGRGETIFVSERDDPAQKRHIVELCNALYSVGTAGHRRSWFRSWEGGGYDNGYVSLYLTRPPQLTIEGLMVNLLGTDDIWTKVPKDRATDALSAVLRGSVVQLNVRR